MKKFLLLACLGLAASRAALAGPADYVVSIYDNEHLRLVDFRLGAEHVNNQPSAGEANLAFGFAVNRRWFAELSASFERSDNEATKFDAFYLVNSFLLTHGQYAFDLGLYTELERAQDRSEGIGLRFGPLLHTELGRTQLQANLLFHRNYDADTPNAMQLAYQWQASYPLQPQLQLGLQGFGELGDWHRWAPRDQQSHRYGPVLLGSYRLNERETLRYEAAFLIGNSNDSHSKTLRARLSYEF
ncbi:MAG: hypothetical protein HYZ65_08015 [Burkholderiales bacterium]|nr:hypothetical protein [Burkholderiales bacterium]